MLISWDEKSCYIEDLKSSNGTYLKDKAIKKVFVKKEAVVIVGKTTLNIFIKEIED